MAKDDTDMKLNRTGMSKPKTACKRCRLKKIKCDNNVPSCSRCAKLRVPCVAVDSATGEDVPRSYILFLEDRVSALMHKLVEVGVNPQDIRGKIPAKSDDKPCNVESYKNLEKNESDDLLAKYLLGRAKALSPTLSIPDVHSSGSYETSYSTKKRKTDTVEVKLPNLDAAVADGTDPADLDETNRAVLGLASIKGTSSSNSFVGDSSGMTFAKLVFTAVNFKPDLISEENDEGIRMREFKSKQYIEATTTSDFDPVELPPRNLAEKYIAKYFTNVNSQLPLFHREFFLKKYFEPIYGRWNPAISLGSDYTKINSDFELPSHAYIPKDETDDAYSQYGNKPWYDVLSIERKKDETKKIIVPKRYHLPYYFLNMVFSIGLGMQVLIASVKTVVTYKRRAYYYSPSVFITTDRLEALTGTVLTVEYALMRPNVPGVWYAMGTVLRLTVDLGLHTEKTNHNLDPYIIDLRRRMFWTVYSLDRQICSYFGRPFGIPEENISTRLPSLLDDAYIVPNNHAVTDYSNVINSEPTTKVVAHSMIEVRKIQADIVRILYAPHAELPRENEDFDNWRASIDERLEQWYARIPNSPEKANCEFNLFFYDLNYHYSKIILYGLSPKCPSLNDAAFQKLHKATKGTIDAFVNLCNTFKVSFTWVAVHNLFMTGMTYLYSVFYYGKHTEDDKNIVLQYTDKVLFCLRNLIGYCDSAKTCYQSYKVLSAAVFKLKYPTILNSNDIKDTLSRNQIKFVPPKLPSSSPISNSSTCFKTDSYAPHDEFHPTDEKRFSEILDIPLDQFFTELEKVSGLSEQQNEHFDPKVLQDGIKSNDATENVHTGPSNFDLDRDILFQVTSQPMWDDLFMAIGNDIGSTHDNNAFPGLTYNDNNKNDQNNSGMMNNI
ncbi:Ppr1p NDAI_0I02350 [Naumovozyma dairenensis CBS 421]|uniref:Zn(2)-C6 fungal-type domain-containing protein n=1 Tax=Naumovozyma dairenensis (strain ATCC 10597 / BCRC 20456 / CBS 421 / NBRC 0211 / NRRL Y-12639) TaxID=1071378 RepID=G0WG93_NAUDC|nr:hypothetical protein NDAI_0I02350 [Naumovozyma dairenensis CBS 421]CCD26804.1 hypothetical protein NDAI_0I02350 [Naumovozyma dairenensis CBS 421]